MKNYIIRKIPAVIIITVFMLLSTFPISSCTHQPGFGNLTICSEIDMVTFAPLEVKNSFDIGVQKILATIEVSGTKAEDLWRFTWTNEDTEEVIADSTDRYSRESSGYIEGYLSNYITPGKEGSIIGEPGNYRVDFYHNSQFVGSASFVIECPEMEITEVVLSNEIDEAGQPAAVMESFHPDDIIYTSLRLNCRIKGETVGVKWYRSENELLGQKEFTIDKDYYLPGYIVFMISNDKLWPVDSYRIEIFRNGLTDSEYNYEVTEGEVSDATFNLRNIYQNEEKYRFSILYPDEWNYEDDESDEGLEIDFMPDSDNISVAVHMRVLKEGYAPSEEEYSDFADGILKNIVDSSGVAEVQKTESTGEVNDITYRQINYHYPGEDKDGWDVDFIFINKNNMLYLLIRVSDLYYQIFADNVYMNMLNSLSFD